MVPLAKDTNLRNIFNIRKDGPKIKKESPLKSDSLKPQKTK